ncbi:BTB/POZ domain-containing protein At3g22104 [Dendrobium catenatum]|uniref:BTB/POZ domain-containing protein n=1 Tax=Dendrobium catenatum TaxID=906689 RepID=A0A2I0W9Y0_9ASPA|nr:BTB/POZ domain-containing protein At3g22104 [Dendrobium catenatum]PKU72466.1 BTB/POZ domain-containing protein [Dendrobium catenatum]
MKLSFDLEVDVNGEEIFFVNKEKLCSFSGKLNKLLSKAPVTSVTKPLKVIFNDLPGGAEAFELLIRFCYNNGRIQITPNNTCLLYFIAQSMEVTEEEVHSSDSLIKQTEKAVESISYWSLPEVLISLKQCQNYFQLSESSGILDKVIDSLVARITTASDTSPSASSPDSSFFRISFDTKSNISTKNSHRRAWWFDDLVILNIEMIDRVIGRMISLKLEHNKISKFLFYYLKCKLSSASDEKRMVTETVIDLLYSLDKNSVSCKGLFDILRISSSQNLSGSCRERLENMIGSQIDQATLDSLLISSPTRTESLYDVNILLRFLRHFLACGGRTSLDRLKKVASLLDLYMAEVAPDVYLKHSKFVALITALPDTARDSHDSLYRAIDMYLVVHNRLTEAEKMKICCSINYAKLSLQSCKHLAQNPKFPPRTAVQALLSQQSKLKGLLQDSNNFKSFDSEQKQSKDGDQTLLYGKKLDPDPLMENEKLKAHLKGMQWRVIELEKACRKMQNQMAKMVKSKTSSPTCSRPLPRLCS